MPSITILISEAEGIRKPDPEIFRRALARLDRGSRGRGVMSATTRKSTSPVLTPPRCAPIWMTSSYHRPPQDADATIHRLADLPAVVAAWR